MDEGENGVDGENKRNGWRKRRRMRKDGDKKWDRRGG